ncbi:MAG: hypothetical protein KIT67_09580 [Alphaproteobacteria bacterium]|nr:hypothetical protein [Alphaproteobacteria bacterium]
MAARAVPRRRLPDAAFLALAVIVTLCAMVIGRIAAAAPSPIEAADLLDLKPGMSLAEVEAALGRRSDVRDVRRISQLTPQARRDKGTETYVRRLIARLSDGRTLSATFVSPLSGAKVVEVSLSQSPPAKPATAILDETTARFGPPASRDFRGGQRDLIAGWNGKAEEQAVITPLPGATVTLRLEVVHDSNATWTLFAHALSKEDNEKVQAFR